MRLNALVREHLTEPRPNPSEMSDTEILNWIGKHCDQAAWCKATPESTGGFVIYSDDIPGRPTKGETIREAVQLADARLQEANRANLARSAARLGADCR